ncbi:hypothetical protein CMQ_865 [Grosmannia clavigera kw1407]|uniref:Uncharacterized protein n=1 Tax=Grosmannia clavigera (strain kw1407 / UAMH 11150) TaxID=655863 RepID=F0XCS3_GROCL|nr:uncharacterized protein CMQ_865 [Grosmannia clavigera kw1407]EFX03937.1 hypothetical protein CMQ_865 [Grosmannia clavigera kw1407]
MPCSAPKEAMMRKGDYVKHKLWMFYSDLHSRVVSRYPRRKAQHQSERIRHTLPCIPATEPLTPLSISGIVSCSSTSLQSWEHIATAATWPLSSPLPPPAEQVSQMDPLEVLTPAGYSGIFAAVDEALSHIRYAVCGPAALWLWGKQETDGENALQLIAPQEISIVCCDSTRDIITSWAACKGLQLYPGRPALIGIPATPDGKIYPLTVNWVDEDTFSQLQIATLANAAGSHIRLLSLETLVNVAATDYAYGESVAKDLATRNALAQDICWLLRRIASAHDESSSFTRLSYQNAPAVLDPIFYVIFLIAHPGSENLFCDAGIELPTDA